jgi:transcriptional regulator with XRE-family HTH domain
MTIKQMADKLGVSPQAIYQKLKKNGVEVYKLTDKKTKELTGEAEVIITKLFSGDPAEIKPSKQTVIDSLQEQVQALRTENAVLVERVKHLEEKVSTLSTDKDTLQKALDKAQDLHQQSLAFLPAAGQTSPERLTWKERFTGRRNKA